jgi:sugar/nucleoside kinase (ribokinase family)
VTSDSTDDLGADARTLKAAGARRMMVPRGSNPVIFRDDGPRPTDIELAAPVFEALDHRGAGVSMLAAIGVGLARGMTPTDAVRPAWPQAP